MSVFKFPSWAIKDLDKLRKSFIWNTGVYGRAGIHLLAWQRVCLPKEVGGMGLHDLKMHNVAMLMRWWWILYHKKDSQWTIVATRLFAKRNCNTSPILWNQSGSFFWRELHALRYLFQISTVRTIGREGDTSFWFDNWGGRPLRFLLPNQQQPPRPFISFRKGIVRAHTLLPMPRSCLDTITLQAAPQASNMAQFDAIRWRWSNSREFSVASLYKTLMLAGKVASPVKKIWKVHVPPTVRLFLFLLASDRLLTQHQLNRRGITFDPKCALCEGQILETSQHLFFNCEFTKEFWAALCRELNIQPPVFTNSILHSVLTLLAKNGGTRKGAVSLATGLWMLWIERNNRIFRASGRRIIDLVECVRSRADDFAKNC